MDELTSGDVVCGDSHFTHKDLKYRKGRNRISYEVGKASSIAWIAIALSALYFLAGFPFEQDAIYQETYLLCAAFCLIALISIVLLKDRVCGYCNPITVITVVYIFIYGICPMHDIKMGEYTWFGYNFFSNGPKALLVTLLSYLCICVGYAVIAPTFKPRKVREPREFESKIIVAIIGVIFAFSFLANAYYMVSTSGNSLLYALSLGFLGDGGGTKSDAALGFIGMFSYSLPAVTLAYVEFGKTKWLKVVAVYLMIALQVSRGFRFIIIQIALMFLTYYWLRNQKLPSAKVIFSSCFVLMALLLFMTMFRSDVRAGAGADLSLISLNSLGDSFDDMFWDNLRIYKNFYGMVGAIPDRVPFAYFLQMGVAPLVMVVPRIVWPGKPEQFGVGVDVILGANFIGTGQAYPNIGEYWYSLGYFGVVLFSLLYGFWMRRIVYRYSESSGNISKMFLAVLISVNLQLIIRGYTPSNLWLVVFSILPLVLMKLIYRLLNVRFSDAISKFEERSQGYDS